MGGRIMVFIHTGRKSGRSYRTPLGYALVEGDICCTAEFGEKTSWYRNVKNDPEVEVWLPDGWWAGRAEEVTNHTLRLRLLREVLRNGGVAGRTLRFDPEKMTDEELQKAAARYRLIRVRLGEARTGPDGPGDLEWVWQLATFALSLVVLIRRGKGRVRGG
jgi:deazaflavin-dependent oxidoreductase (nitroreductase family)